MSFPEGTEFNILSLDLTNPAFTATSKAIEPGHVWEISITPPKNSKLMESQFAIKTDKAVEGAGQVVIYGYARISPEPPPLAAEEEQKRPVAKAPTKGLGDEPPK